MSAAPQQVHCARSPSRAVRPQAGPSLAKRRNGRNGGSRVLAPLIRSQYLGGSRRNKRTRPAILCLCRAPSVGCFNDELVSCLNSIEGSYRAELRDLFAAHFGRSEEKLERRLADLRVELHSTKADMLKWSVRLWVPVTLAVIGLYFKR